MDRVVRLACQDDAGKIARIHQRSWAEGYRGIVADRWLCIGYREDHWTALLSDPAKMEILVVDREPGVVGGFISFASRAPYGDEDEHSAPCAEPGAGAILALYVTPGVWRQGLGGTLVKAALERLGESGCEAVGAWVLAKNHAALAFYACCGFLPSGIAGAHIPTGSPEIHLRRRLNLGASWP